MKNSKKLLLFIILAAILCSVSSVFAVSSYTYNTGGNRLYLASGNKFYVFVEEGDTVYVGTSSKSDRYDLRIIMPDLEKRLYKLNEINEGYIENRAQEMAGPNVFSPDGYIPIVAEAQQTGYMEITLYGSNKNTANAGVEDPWGQCDYGYCVTAAWDITVADRSGQIREGRVFAKKITMVDVQTDCQGLNVYALTEDGYIYLFETGRINGGEWTVSAANRGVIHLPTNKMIYSSVQNNKEFKRDYMIGIENFGRTVWQEDPKIISFQDSGYIKNGKIHHYEQPREIKKVEEDPTVFDPGFRRSWYGDSLARLFFEYPSPELLEHIDLTEPMPAPLAFDINFEKQENGSYILSFESDRDYGVYEMRITFPDDENFKKTVSLGNYVDYYNELTWDGRDNKGDIAANTGFTAQLFLKAGEIHFDIDDIEYIYDGLKITNLNASGSSRVYYDNEEAVIDGSRTYINVLQCSDIDGRCRRVNYVEKNGSLVDAADNSKIMLLGKVTRKNGIESSTGISMQTGNGYSDELMMDIWSYDPDYNVYEIAQPAEYKQAPVEHEPEPAQVETAVEEAVQVETAVEEAVETENPSEPETEPAVIIPEEILEEAVVEIVSEDIIEENDFDMSDLPEASVEMVQNTGTDYYNGIWFTQTN